MALGQYKLGHYNEARRFNDVLLEREPRSMQALSLKALIDDRVVRGISHFMVVRLIGRRVCGYGDRWQCNYWIHCCGCDVVETALSSFLVRFYSNG